MILTPALLLYQIGWLSAIIIYHEPSMKEFGPGITTSQRSFGYSVTFKPDDRRLIVSAPKGSDVGALFTCDIDHTNCTEIPPDNIHGLFFTKTTHAPKNFHIWLGATVKAGSNFFVTCAPRFKKRINAKNDGIDSTCYSYYTNPRSGLLKPTLMKIGYMNSGSAKEHTMTTFGWSIDIDSSDKILIGGPAMWHGRAIKYDSLRSPAINIEFRGVRMNFGYSVVHRQYCKRTELAISSTYGERGFGMVILRNDDNGQILHKIKGEQVGSMFGASLCAVSVDSQGQSVILVGAPTYTHQDMCNSGAVFIYKDDNTNVYSKVLGTKDHGQFGYAMANLGDLNGDKKDDVAISAPYEDEGHGVVYIYSGADLMDRDKQASWMQRIKKEKYYSFGLSLYAVPDYDKNGCKELAIGIPQSNKTVLFSCLATIRVTVKELKPIEKIYTSGSPSFIFKSCLAFQYPALPKIINATFSVQVDISDANYVKILDQSSNNSFTYYMHVTSDKKNEYCRNLTISTPEDKSYEPTLGYQISAVLLQDPKDKTMFSPSAVTVSDLSVLTVPGTAWIGECKNDKKCVPQLEMTVDLSISSKVTYVVGSTDVETVSISIKNSGDPAYSACVRLFLYGIILLSGPVSCGRAPTGDPETLICKPVKLFRNNTTWDIEDLRLDTKAITSNAEEAATEFNVTVLLYDDCNSRVATQIWNKTISLHSNSENVTVTEVIKNGGMINITRNEIEYSSKQIQHEYIIYNNGPTTWQNVKFTISLRKEFFLDGISTISGNGYECTSYEETDEHYINHCEIQTLKKQQKFEIVLPIDIMSNIYETLKKKQLTVQSYLKFYLDGAEKLYSIITTLHFFVIKVAIWIIVIAVLFGLMFIVIIIFILYEIGFLRRKKKDDLQVLKKDVKRQSMRRSTIIQHNPMDVSDQEKLIEVSEDALPNDKPTTITTKAEIHENETESKKSENEDNVNKQREKQANEDIQCKTKENNKQNEKKGIDDEQKDTKQDFDPKLCTAELDNKGNETNDKDLNISSVNPKKIKGKANDSIANIILGGLQKNLRERDVASGEREISSEDDRLA